MSKVYHVRLEVEHVEELRQRARVASAKRAVDITWQELLREGLARMVAAKSAADERGDAA